MLTCNPSSTHTPLPKAIGFPTNTVVSDAGLLVKVASKTMVRSVGYTSRKEAGENIDGIILY